MQYHFKYFRIRILVFQYIKVELNDIYQYTFEKYIR